MSAAFLRAFDRNGLAPRRSVHSRGHAGPAAVHGRSRTLTTIRPSASPRNHAAQPALGHQQESFAMLEPSRNIRSRAIVERCVARQQLINIRKDLP